MAGKAGTTKKQTDPVTLYARRAVAGEYIVNKLVVQACQKHLDDLKSGAARGLKWSPSKAKRAIKFFDFLKHSKGEWAGQSFKLELWQKFIIGSIFGWLRSDGTRRYRTAYVEIPRKNGKSTLSAGVALYTLIADGEQGAEVYSAATKRDQAKIVHTEAVRMVKASPSLKRRVRVYRDNLSVLKTNSKFEPLGADGDTLDGLNIHAAVIDEFHAHKTRAVSDVLDTATGARRQSLIFYITTAGWDRTSVCFEYHHYSEQLLAGVIEDDSWFSYIATLDKDDDWKDPSVWAKANPNFGISVKPDDLARKCQRARNVPAAQNAFKRLHLNVWTEQSERWLDLEKWDECAGEIDLDLLVGRECYAGLDLSSSLDITALELVFPGDEVDEEDNEVTYFDVLSFFWVPEETVVERTMKGSVPYQSWVEAGLIEATPGNVIDYKAISHKLDELAQLYDIKEVGFDRWGSTQLQQDLIEQGMEIVPIGQGYASLSAPTKELMVLVLSKRVRHGGNPVLRWMASNMVVTMDPAGNIKPDKGKSTEKIDGMVALIMGLDRATRREGGGIEEGRGLLLL